jgi:hypothetical protein
MAGKANMQVLAEFSYDDITYRSDSQSSQEIGF